MLPNPSRVVVVPFLLHALLAVAACSSAPPASAPAPGGSGPAASAEASGLSSIRAADGAPIDAPNAVIVVSGLACPKCASNIDVQLSRIPGVRVRSVDMKHGLVRVEFERAPHPTSQQLARAVEDAGLTWRGWSPLDTEVAAP